MSEDELKLLNDTAGLVQTGWMLVCAALVLFMQAGFACVEAGSVRHKNSINVAIKNVIDFCIAFPGYMIIGFALMFGATQGGWIGEPKLFLAGVPNDKLTSSYQDCVVNTLNWYRQEAKKVDLVCANEQYYLLRDGSHTCWPQANCDAFAEAAVMHILSSVI